MSRLRLKDGSCVVYALCEPDSITVRYVGQTTWTPKYRLSKHISNAIRNRNKSHLYAWIRKLYRENTKPNLIVLEYNAKWNDSEAFWIKSLKDSGIELINHTNGGDGILGYKHTKEAKIKIGRASKGNKYAAGIIQSEETKIKRANKLKKPVLCVETDIIYPSAREAEIVNGLSRGMITHTVRGKYKTANGYHWRYANG